MTTTGAASPADYSVVAGIKTAQRASATPAPAGQASPAAPSRGGDTVDLSPLASALKGNALTIFNEALTDDDRQKLDEAVRAGTLTGEEVASGLTTRMKRAGFAFRNGLEPPKNDRSALDRVQQQVDRLNQSVAALGRGEQPPATEAAPSAIERTQTPSRGTSPADGSFRDTGKAPTGDDAARLAFLNTLDDGGDAAAQKISNLGINLGLFGNFGEKVVSLLDKGAFTY